jgi:hypothetical protein
VLERLESRERDLPDRERDLRLLRQRSEPFVLPDGSALYFTSTRTGSMSYDLYRAARGTAGQFTTPTQVSTINTPSGELAPVPPLLRPRWFDRPQDLRRRTRAVVGAPPRRHAGSPRAT